MDKKLKTLSLSAAAALLALLAGTCVMAALGVEPPAMLLAWEMLFFTAIGLAAGFLWRLPRLPWWVASRPVLGTALITLGVGAVYVPAQFIVSSLFLGAGARLLWLSLSEPRVAGGEIARWSGGHPGVSEQRQDLQRRHGAEVCPADAVHPVPECSRRVPR